jgi:hypothetical protein
MSEYWTMAIPEILAEEGIEITAEQAVSLGKAIAGCASVEAEYSGVVERTKPGKPQKSEERQRIERLEEIIRRLGVRFGVGIDVNAGEINYLTPVGASHWGTHRETLPS